MMGFLVKEKLYAIDQTKIGRQRLLVILEGQNLHNLNKSEFVFYSDIMQPHLLHGVVLCITMIAS